MSTVHEISNEQLVARIKAGEDTAGNMAQLYEQMFSCDCRIMETHAPECVRGQVARVVFQTLIFRTVGLMGDCAVKSGLLALPDFQGPAVYVRENTKAAQEASLENQLRWQL